jgi:hypothetical protein
LESFFDCWMKNAKEAQEEYMLDETMMPIENHNSTER